MLGVNQQLTVGGVTRDLRTVIGSTGTSIDAARFLGNWPRPLNPSASEWYRAVLVFPIEARLSFFISLPPNTRLSLPRNELLLNRPSFSLALLSLSLSLSLSLPLRTSWYCCGGRKRRVRGAWTVLGPMALK